MAATIDGNTMLGWQGVLTAAVRRMAPLPPRPGTNGKAFVMDAYQAPVQVLVTTNELIAAAVPTTIAAYRALMDGNDKVIVDPLGVSWTAKIVEVTCVPYALVTGKFKLISTWKVQIQSGP